MTLIRETLPRWRQVLLGLPEDPNGPGGPGMGGAGRVGPGIERTVSGGGGAGGGGGVGLGGGPTGPGGPPQLNAGGTAPSAAEYLITVAGNAGALGASVIGTNPSQSSQALNLDGIVVCVRGSDLFHYIENAINQCIPIVKRENTVTNKSVYPMSGRYGVGPNGEPELSLEGRYDDEDHKLLAVYGAMLVGEKCRPSEKLNLVSFFHNCTLKRLAPKFWCLKA